MQEPEGRPSEEESSSSEDEREWRKELKKQRKEARKNEERPVLSKPKFYELKSGENFTTVKSAKSTAALKEKKLVSVLTILMLRAHLGIRHLSKIGIQEVNSDFSALLGCIYLFSK